MVTYPFVKGGIGLTNRGLSARAKIRASSLRGPT